MLAMVLNQVVGVCAVSVCVWAYGRVRKAKNEDLEVEVICWGQHGCRR